MLRPNCTSCDWFIPTEAMENGAQLEDCGIFGACAEPTNFIAVMFLVAPRHTRCGRHQNLFTPKPPQEVTPS